MVKARTFCECKTYQLIRLCGAYKKSVSSCCYGKLFITCQRLLRKLIYFQIKYYDNTLISKFIHVYSLLYTVKLMLNLTMSTLFSILFILLLVRLKRRRRNCGNKTDEIRRHSLCNITVVITFLQTFLKNEKESIRQIIKCPIVLFCRTNYEPIFILILLDETLVNFMLLKMKNVFLNGSENFIKETLLEVIKSFLYKDEILVSSLNTVHGIPYIPQYGLYSL